MGSGGGSGETGKYCCLCGAWFNNPLMAQQHYEGKKHRRNAARVGLLEQLAGSLDATETTGEETKVRGQGLRVKVRLSSTARERNTTGTQHDITGETGKTFGWWW